MKDSLKKFISDHRQAFDHREPSEEVWNRVEANLPAARVSWWNNVAIWRAAAVIFLGISAYLFFSGYSLKPSQQSASMLGELMNLERFYNDQITEKVELINQINKWDADDSFTQDLQKLDAMYELLREQMKSNPSAKLKDALILNMLVRIDLLNQQIEKLETTKENQSSVTI
jgi:hypothetical protein